MLGDRALGLLLRLKLRGFLRKQWRRLRTPKGAIATLAGLGVFAFWGLTLVASSFFRESVAPDPEVVRPMLRLGCLFLCVLTLVGSLSHRGLYLPREEIERLFSSPATRANLIRYRLLSNVSRSLVAVPFIGLLLMRRVPEPGFGLLAVALGLATLPVFGQLVSILAGSLERRLTRALAVPRVVLLVVALVGFVWMVLIVTTGDDDSPFAAFLARLAPDGDASRVFAHPVVARVTAPFEPWARVGAASSWGELLPWFGGALVIWYVLFELTARLPIDYRELSLETSANVAARIRRARRTGGGASAAKISRRTAGWRVPWWFGRGPVGALVWRKSCGIVRKARGTLWVSALVLALLTLFGTQVFDGGGSEEVLGGALFLVVLGTLYLCSGLKFDFRDDLDRMDDIKAWPVPPARLFAAMLLPEVFLVSGLLTVGVVVRAVVTGGFHPLLIVLCVGLPPVVFAWVALDNAVFLFSPVRIVPGQDGGVQNLGRAAVLMFLRLILLLVVSVLIAAVSSGTWALATYGLELGEKPAALLAGVAGYTVLIAVDAILVWVGGALFRRFDVASDRG